MRAQKQNITNLIEFYKAELRLVLEGLQLMMFSTYLSRGD